jgi:hypothetical protein
MDRVAHESVLEPAGVGVPDEDGLVKPEAFVVVKPGVLAGEELARALEDHARTMLAPFKCPRWFAFLDDPPKPPARSNGASCARRRRWPDGPHNLLQPNRVALNSTPNRASASQMRWRLRRDRPAFADALDADLRNRG